MEQLGIILRIVDKYLKVMDTVIQVDPQVNAIVWTSIRAIMQVRITLDVHALSLYTNSIGRSL